MKRAARRDAALSRLIGGHKVVMPLAACVMLSRLKFSGLHCRWERPADTSEVERRLARLTASHIFNHY
jgi:hypothetical protein